LRPDVDAVVRALIRLSTYTADVDSFSAGAAIRQLQIGARPGVLYLHGGWVQLVVGLASKVKVQAGTEVLGLEPEGRRVRVGTAAVTAIRYVVTNADADRRSLEAHVARLGVARDDIVAHRFLARMVVSGAMPRAETGGLAGRPRVTDSGQPGVLIAGDWVGPE